mgnify:CR=1 FL=1
MYLNSSKVSLKGLPLPLMQQQQLDSKFADDRTIYVQGNDDNLSKLQVVMEEFCLVSSAKINWHKFLGFWVSQNSLPTWMSS